MYLLGNAPTLTTAQRTDGRHLFGLFKSSGLTIKHIIQTRSISLREHEFAPSVPLSNEIVRNKGRTHP